MTTLIQMIATILIVKYLGSTFVHGRPRPVEGVSRNDELNGGLRDLNLRRLKRFLQIRSRDGSNAGTGKKEMNHRHLQRIKRDLSKNPCYERGSFKKITLSDGTVTHSLRCKPSTNLGCFHNIASLSTTLCSEQRTFFTSSMQSVVQGCSCAS